MLHSDGIFPYNDGAEGDKPFQRRTIKEEKQ